MVGDPNWLYSTIAQSSAAIVAIIGGFITATALGLRSEKSRLRRLLAEMNKGESKENAGSLKLPNGTEIPLTIFEAAATRFHLEYLAPRFIRWGILVIAYLACSGIVLPVIFIGCELFQSPLRWLILVLFCLGIIGLLFYIGWLARELKKE